MEEIIFVSVAVFLLIVSALMMYLYLTVRQKEQKKLKDFFTFTFHKKKIIYMSATLVLILFAFFYSFYFLNSSFMRSCMNAEVLLWLMVLGLIDWKEKIIPNAMTLVGLSFWVLLVILEIFVGKSPWKQVIAYSLAGGLICGGILMIIALIVKNALGMGDVKMFTVIGLLYGLFETYSILLVSIFIMAIVSIVLLIMKKVTKNTAVPMAPFVAIGFFINLLMGI